jgi:hypothetical protein
MKPFVVSKTLKKYGIGHCGHFLKISDLCWNGPQFQIRAPKNGCLKKIKV